MVLKAKRADDHETRTMTMMMLLITIKTMIMMMLLTMTTQQAIMSKIECVSCGSANETNFCNDSVSAAIRLTISPESVSSKKEVGWSNKTANKILRMRRKIRSPTRPEDREENFTG